MPKGLLAIGFMSRAITMEEMLTGKGFKDFIS